MVVAQGAKSIVPGVSRQGAAIKKRNVEEEEQESRRNVAKHEFRVRS